ncbi:unnamed protein product [Arctogadus glacialis]
MKAGISPHHNHLLTERSAAGYSSAASRIAPAATAPCSTPAHFQPGKFYSTLSQRLSMAHDSAVLFVELRAEIGPEGFERTGWVTRGARE